MRLIDADALAKFIDYGHLNNPNEKLYSENDIREMIDMMPTINAVPVRHGKWIDGYILDEPIEVCSECNTFYMLKFSGGGMRYCPNCGARMDEDNVE